MFRKVEDFVSAYTIESQATQKLLDVLTDASLEQVGTPGHRKLGRMAWHIVACAPEMATRMGLTLTARNEKEVPASAKAIAEAYRVTAAEVLAAVKDKLTDETLLIEDDMYGEMWARGRTLYVLLSHEAHHRGQMTVLMRQAGLPVAGPYGPSQDEWGQYGMEAQP